MRKCVIAFALALFGAVFAGPAIAEELDPHLLGWWKFEEGYGSVAKDSSGHGLDATLQGSPVWGKSGRHRGIVVLDGVDDCLRIDGSSLKLPLYSIALWFRVDSGTAVKDILSAKGPSGVNGVLLELAASGTLRYLHRFPFASSGGNNINTTSTYADRLWHHVAAVKSATEMKLYVDGQLVGTQADSTQFEGVLGDIWIGTLDQRLQRLLPGAVDDVRIYDRVLSDEEVSKVMAGEPAPLAYSPQPGNGALYAITWAVLEWGPGDLAVSHNVYFGDSAGAVTNGTPDDEDVFRGSVTEPAFRVGMAGAPYPAGLQRGVTYYWRIDEVNDLHPQSPWKGEVWSFTIPPQIAWKPVPAQGARFVDPNADLRWQPGQGAVLYNVYFGEGFDSVKTATTPKTMVAQPTFDPGPLGPGQTYYWRIDEFDGTAWHPGDVWSFTVATPGGGLKGEYFNNVDLAGAPVLTRTDSKIDFDWADGSPAPNVINPDNFSVRWLGELEIAFSETYTFYLDADNGVRLWVSDQLVIDQWTAFRRNEFRSKPVVLAAGGRYSLLLEFNEQDTTAAARLFWESASQPKEIIPSAAFSLPVRALAPRPYDGAVDAGQTLTLTWRSGDYAAQHDVYFADSEEAVANATPASTGVYQGRQALDVTAFDPDPLAWNKTYYWRVDEVNDARADSPWKGPVWSFTTADFIVIDDFESYTDEEGQCVFDMWIDGFTDGLSGSLVGLYPDAVNGTFCETTIVHGGRQSMPFQYDNAKAPYYSEAQRTWAKPQDWTVNGVDTLTLYVRGTTDNSTDKLYVSLQDSAGKTATTTVEASLTATLWTPVSVPLSRFMGVDLHRVKVLFLGVGDRNSPALGGAGQIYFDDIRVVKAAPAAP